ncbi:large ribosomal subunit protein mL43-like [Amphiura filiformis]|uniref:large ribosomal subunit protein mL43-like n=1 Tax=Amphiura filiformis TaxID=82378 RepID=UPI003B214658
MSLTSSVIRPTGYLSSILQNGVGRYVCQLQRLTFQFHKSSKEAMGVREFVEQDIVDFAKQNPQIVLYVTPHEKYRDPKVVAEFLNGNVRKVHLLNKPRDEVLKDVELLSAQSGRDIIKMRKWWHTDNPSVQGMWHPFTNKPTNLNVAEFPMKNPSLQVKARHTKLSEEVMDNLRKELKSNECDVKKVESSHES